MSETAKKKMAIIASKGTLDMAYPGLVLANAALGEGIETHIFFTFWGMDMITKKRIDHLQLAPVANTSMKMSMMGVPGNLGIPNLMGVLPGMTKFAYHARSSEERDFADLAALGSVWGKKLGEPGFHDDLDLDGDGSIWIGDLVILLQSYGHTP